MSRKDLKTRTAIYTALDNNVHQKLTTYLKANKLQLSKVLDEALMAYLKEKGVEIHE